MVEKAEYFYAVLQTSMPHLTISNNVTTITIDDNDGQYVHYGRTSPLNFCLYRGVALIQGWPLYCTTTDHYDVWALILQLFLCRCQQLLV